MSAPLPVKDNVCCLVITYHPDDGLPSRISAVAGQVDCVLIIDNASDPSELAPLKNLSLPNVHVLSNNRNVGVAAALNQGMEWAQARSYEWVLAVDQDSEAQARMLGGLAEALREWTGCDPVAVIGSNYLDRATCVPFFGGDDARLCEEVVTVITSGSLFSVAAYGSVGPFREDYFIDHVDDEYCLRARTKGFSVLITREVLMFHGIGFPSKHRLGGRQLSTTNAPPIRRYYIARNCLAMVREYRRREPVWTKSVVRTRVKEVVLMLLFEGQKMRKTWMTLKGLVHALRGRMGPLEG